MKIKDSLSALFENDTVGFIYDNDSLHETLLLR